MKHVRLFAAAAAVLALDRAGKLLWKDADTVLLPGVLALRGTRNTGMAFGWFSGSPWPLAAVAAAVCAGLLLYLRGRRLGRLSQYGLGLILGGALGNLADRVLYGYVIDFIDPVFLHWFICNIADIGITCGALLLAARLLFGKEETHK